ncbi:amino acid adenylation domain-containing protein [Vibrio sp. M260112]|uniref:amino acid adenylation domain-containing protein n=1 Tax=Vibrio sp. M260112 TaxID=3020895 RepID=UPI002F3E7CB0
MDVLTMNHNEIFSLLKQLKEQGIRLRAMHGELKVSSENGALDAEKVALIKSHKNQFLDYFRESASTSVIDSSEAQRFEPFELNENQQAYWLGRSQSVEGGGVAIHLYFEIDATGLDIDRLQLAWDTMVQRHDMLRAVVTPDGHQKVLNAVTVQPFTVVEAEDGFDATVAKTRERLSHANYDLTLWPQHQFEVVASHDKKTLCLSLDCWCIDGWSYQILFQEWLQLYRSAQPLPSIELTFRDYCRHVGGTLSQQQVAYIDKQAHQLPPAPAVPERQRSSVTPVFQRYDRWLSNEQILQLKRWCASQGVTLASTLLTLYAEVLHLWSSNDRFTVNVPRFNRNIDDARIHQIIGEFATFSLVGFDFSVEMDRADRIKQAQRSVLESVEAGVSGVDILRKRNALTDSVQTMPFVFTNAPEWITPSGEKQSFIDTLQQFGRLEYAISQTPQVKIDCQYHESRDGLYVFWDAREYQFYPGQVGQMFAVFIDSILGLLGHATQAQLPEIAPMVLTEDRVLLIGDVWTDFTQTVARYPNQMAIACEQGETTWSELATRVSVLASQIAECELAPHQPILIMAEKGWQQMAAYLAIHHQGHIAVPVDGSNPVSRLQFIAEDTQAPLILCSTLYQGLAAQIGVSTLDIAGTTTDLAMPARQMSSVTMLIIYTSGSTGQPKGVQIAAAAMHNAVNATIQRFQFDQQDVFFGLTQLHHDMAWFDLLAAIKTGGALVYPASKNYRDPQSWLCQMTHYGVTCWNSVPQLMQMLLAALKQTPSKLLNEVRVAFLGGDWIPLSTHSEMQAMLPNARLVSVGGPTETTLWNIMYEVTTFDNTWSSVPYGQPIANNQYRILDRHGRDCPLWVEGELCCSGVGVTPGYVNRPELENEKFYEGTDGQRYYRTGDIGRYRSDGNIEFIGRQDDQIMVGGYRIESQEIHRALESHRAIEQAQVVVKGNELQAYLVAEPGQNPSVEELNALLEAQLPAQMIPSLYFVVESIPLTANGKVDKSALSSMHCEPLTAKRQVEADITRPEHRVVAVLWEEVLGRAPQTPHDDFFLLGGHSLTAVELFALMFPQGHNKHSVVSLFELRTVEQQAALMLDNVDVGVLALSHRPLSGAELSQGQKRICFVEQMTQQPNLFNLPFRIALRQGCDIDRLHASLERTLVQFDVFQSTLLEGHWIRTTEMPRVSVHRLPLNESIIENLSREQAREGLDLTSGHGWRAKLVTHEDGHYELLLTVHHALFDGWSLQVLLKAWQDNYGEQHERQPDRADYFNYCQWESQAKAAEHEIAFWQRQLEGYQNSALLPTQLAPQYNDFSAATEGLALDTATVRAIRVFAEQQGSTEFAVMMSTFQLLISRYLAQDDVVIGTHVANRPTAQIQNIPGLFLNNVAIRLCLDADWSVEQLIANQTQTLLAALKHSTLPFDRVVSEVDAGGDGRRHPLYQTSFVLDNSKSFEGELGCVIKPTEQAALSTELEMNVQLNKDSGRINLVYRTGLFTAFSMRQLLAQYQTLLNQMLAQPSRQLRTLCYNAEPEEAVLNGPSLPIPSETVRALWLKVVETRPHAPAYMDETVTLTFAQLDERAHALAIALSSIGIGEHSRVGVHLDLGEEWLVSLLALIKLSACYVPLATNLPNGRLQQMVAISECELVLGQSNIDLGVPYVAPSHVKDIEHLGGEARQIDKPFLYVTFTSGSTGTPKAVAATEESALNRFTWTWQQMPYAEHEVCALKTSISFVDSIAEVFTPLLKGIPLALIPTQAQCDPEAFAQCIANHGVTRLVMVPSLMETLVEHGQKYPEMVSHYRSLSHVVLSGETLSLTLAQRVKNLWPHLQLWNVYGSAEVAADVLAKRIDLRHPHITLGQPFFNTRIELRDNWGCLTPLGGKGELMISGTQVIAGYLGETPFPRNARGEATFASSDMAQLHSENPALESIEVVFVGRQQQLVKIRGQKVSLAEIRETLTAHEAITQLAVVMVDEQRIGVMYTPNTVSPQSLQNLAEKYLPRYMRPQVWLGVDNMPLLATGKVDLRAVTAGLQQQPESSSNARALTKTENDIAQLWQSLTGICPRDPDSHFFDMGGHSLLVNSLTNALNQAFGLSLRLGLVYDSLILSEMAELIETLVTTRPVQSSIKEAGVI